MLAHTHIYIYIYIYIYICLFLDCHVPETSAHLEYDTVSRGNQIPMFGGNVVSCSARVSRPYKVCNLQWGHNTAAKPLRTMLYLRRMESSYKVMLHSLLRLLILMRGKFMFVSVSGKFLTFLVSKAGYI
jgi:hypothetical protein